MDLPNEFTRGYVASKDGTEISYRQLGSGPGIILVHGAMQASQNFMFLGRILAQAFSVYIPDRQGRALSDTRNNHSLAGETEDIKALIEKTKTENVFGLSSGAIVSLQTAITTPAIKKLAIYEPPIPVDGEAPSNWYAEYEKAIAEGNWAKAFVYILKGTSDKSMLTSLPAFITAPILKAGIKRQTVKEGDATIKSLVEAFKYDYKIVNDSKGIIGKCALLDADVLLLGGEKSQGYLQATLQRLNIELPKAKRVILPGVGHIAADNSERPDLVARELAIFFSGAD